MRGMEPKSGPRAISDKIITDNSKQNGSTPVSLRRLLGSFVSGVMSVQVFGAQVIRPLMTANILSPAV
jgi:hypothetical protein